jgi:anaerobic magnesium-protoporphyrin IX monomethyl ester cyclase
LGIRVSPGGGRRAPRRLGASRGVAHVGARLAGGRAEEARMPLRIVLLTPARRFIANRFGLGYQIPLGLVCLGGPLADAGHAVRLIDNDLYGWEDRRLGADAVLLGHTGSTAAHPTCLATAAALKAALPGLRLAYGGVFPTYAAEAALDACPAIDVVVRGEAEQTVLDLTDAWEQGRPLAGVAGIAFRQNGRVVQTRPRPPIADLDAYRPGWELVDWPGYTLFGLGRSAGVQFSRGCPLTCTYCGQWLFWRRWRHRSPADLVGQLTILARDYGVKVVWLADENFGVDRRATEDVLDRLIAADLGLSLNVNLTAADVVRDADLLPRYKAAGVDYVVMGVESLEDAVIATVRKNNPAAVSRAAVGLLRRHGIISLVNIIYGLEDETPRTLWRKFRGLCALDPDILNAVYLTPHFWTAAGRATDPAALIQPDLARWTYRNQVTVAPGLSPAALFWGVKLTEALVHLRPSALMRLAAGADRRVRRIRRASLAAGIRVWLAEITEFLLATRFVRPGALDRLPGAPTREPGAARDDGAPAEIDPTAIPVGARR